MKKIQIREKVYVEEIKDMMRQPGNMMINVILKNDSYKGFDKQQKVIINVLKEVQRAEVIYDDEDVQAAK
jgi:hypothetical protein